MDDCRPRRRGLPVADALEDRAQLQLDPLARFHWVLLAVYLVDQFEEHGVDLLGRAYFFITLVFRAPVDVILEPTTPLALQPDIVYIPRDHAHIVTDRIEGVPDLVVEVLSPGSRDYDRTERSARYAAGGVTEYWLADLENQTIEMRRLDQRPPVTVAAFAISDTLTSPLLPGFALPVASGFAR